MVTRIGVDEYGDIMLYCSACQWLFVYPEGATPTLTDASVLDLAHLTKCRPRKRERRVVEGPSL